MEQCIMEQCQTNNTELNEEDLAQVPGGIAWGKYAKGAGGFARDNIAILGAITFVSPFLPGKVRKIVGG
jgi:hypothetical protein